MNKGMKENQILVVIKEPEKPPRVEPLFDNQLEAFQAAVGGYIEAVTVTTDLVIICNEEGRLKRLPWNCTAFGVDFVGTVVVAGVKEDEFASVRAKYVPTVLRMLGGC